jgi:hypothetical protein
MITWPFARGTWHAFAEFETFEQELLAARRADSKLDADLRLNRESWIKVWNEELYPVQYFCRHIGVAIATEFSIGLEGADADIEIRNANMLRRLQITTAGPLWTDGLRQWGRDHMLHMEQLNQTGQSAGWGPYRREPDGSITNRDAAISTDERDPAHLAGIRQALLGKRFNQHANCELIVYAAAYNEVMTVETFGALAAKALHEVPLADFLAVHVLAAGEGYIVSQPASAPT